MFGAVLLLIVQYRLFTVSIGDLILVVWYCSVAIDIGCLVLDIVSVLMLLFDGIGAAAS